MGNEELMTQFMPDAQLLDEAKNIPHSVYVEPPAGVPLPAGVTLISTGTVDANLDKTLPDDTAPSSATEGIVGK